MKIMKSSSSCWMDERKQAPENAVMGNKTKELPNSTINTLNIFMYL